LGSVKATLFLTKTMEKFRKYYPKEWFENLRIMYKPMKIENLNISFDYFCNEKRIKFTFIQNGFYKTEIDCNLIQTLDTIHYLEYMNYKFNNLEIEILNDFLNSLVDNLNTIIFNDKQEQENKRDWDSSIKIKDCKNIKTYIMKDNHNNLYKIGKSKNPKIREKTLQSEKPSIKIIKIFDKNIENELHLKYNKNRIRGEWFNLNKIQIKYICTHY
jgi:hypothetical protein